jgi:hypothetical protein
MKSNKTTISTQGQKSRNPRRRPLKRNSPPFAPFYPNITRRSCLICHDVGGFPDTYITTLRYSVSGVSMGTGASTTDSKTYLLNSPGGLTHLPKGWNTLKEVYNEFLVRKMSWVVNVRNTSSTIPVRAYVLPVAYDYVAALTSSIVALSETEGVIIKSLGLANSGHDIAMVHGRTGIESLAGLDKPVSTENDTYTGYTGSANSTSSYLAPVNLYQLAIAIFSETGANIVTGGIIVSVDLNMDIEFYGKLPIY